MVVSVFWFLQAKPCKMIAIYWIYADWKGAKRWAGVQMLQNLKPKLSNLRDLKMGMCS